MLEAKEKAEKAKKPEPAEQYIAEREEKRQRGLDVPKHEKYPGGEEGTFEFAGIRNVGGQALALLKNEESDTVFVRPVDQDTAEKLKRIGIGDKVNVTQDGIRKRGMRR
jgi:hypothetical protein